MASALAAGAATGGAMAVTREPAPAHGLVRGVAGDRLGPHDLRLLAVAQAKGAEQVVLIVATEKGRAEEVSAGLRKLGGRVAKQVDGVGYVRASLPTSAVRDAAKLSGVAAVDLNESFAVPRPKIAPAGRVRAQPNVVAPGDGTPAANPFLPAHEMGSVAFKAEHPSFDGRGVTVGIMDTGVDVDHPALQTTSTGERKIVDWFTATDPILDSDGTWRQMSTAVTGPSFTFGGNTWTAPVGTFKVNQFSESSTKDGEAAGDVNRDGDTTDKFGILYDPVSHDIRVDGNNNRDFTDDPAMRPYAERFDIGHFGTDNPNTPAIREQMPFTVEYREDVDLAPLGQSGVADFVNIGIAEISHGTHVAGIAAGDNLMGNPVFDGNAPGAKIVSARTCLALCTTVALAEGMIDLVVNRGVDVVSMSLGGLPALNDGNDARSLLYNRLIDDYDVQMFIAGGNEGPGVNTVDGPAVASNVVSVAAGISREAWTANYGSVVRKPYNLTNFSSRGPREDGGFKPNITAPGSAISAWPLWQASRPIPASGYGVPPGYATFEGTSMSTP